MGTRTRTTTLFAGYSDTSRFPIFEGYSDQPSRFPSPLISGRDESLFGFLTVLVDLPSSPDPPLLRRPPTNAMDVGVAGDRFEWGRGKRFVTVLPGEDPPHDDGRGRKRSDGGLVGEGATATSFPDPRFQLDPDPPRTPAESEVGHDAMEDEEYASDFAQVWLVEAGGVGRTRPEPFELDHRWRGEHTRREEP